MIISYRNHYFAGTKALWQEALPDDQPWNASEFVIPAKLAVQPDLFLLAVEDDKVIGSVIAGYDGHRGWLYSVAVLTAYRKRGIGASLVREAEKRLEALGCAKINLQVRSTNAVVIGFYKGLGYEVEERTSMGKRVGRFAPRPEN